MTPFHAWLIRKRKWCEHEGCIMTLNNATQVRKVNGKDFVYCDKHAGRLDFARKLERKQHETAGT